MESFLGSEIAKKQQFELALNFKTPYRGATAQKWDGLFKSLVHQLIVWTYISLPRTLVEKNY